MEKKEFEFGRDSAYKLISVTNRDGRDKSNDRNFYRDRIGCIVTDFRYDDHPSVNDLYRLNMRFVRNANGMWANRPLHTSAVFEVKGTEDKFEIVTANSVYTFEKSELVEIPTSDEKGVIELFLSNEDHYMFAKGFFHTQESEVYELTCDVHLGMFTDSVILRFIHDEFCRDYACRYFPERYRVCFYNTIYRQQDYSMPMHIYNVGREDLQIYFESFPHIWTIKPGESKRIIPFDATGADPKEEK